MNSSLHWNKFWLVLWIFGMAMGMYLSLMPTTPRQQVIPHLDKFIHGCSYALLAIFAVCIFEQKSARWKAIAWLIVFGGLIELAQGYLPTGRTMEFNDFVANSIGIFIGAYLAARVNVLKIIEHKLQFNHPKQ
jgi:VanZ family protein